MMWINLFLGAAATPLVVFLGLACGLYLTNFVLHLWLVFDEWRRRD